MGSEEPTDEGRTRRVIGDEVQMPQTGIITEVYEHTTTDDKWNFHVDVKIGPDRHPRRVPVATSGPEKIAPPRSISHPDGPDLALVQYMDDSDNERAIVTNILYNNEDRPPLGKEGIYRIRRGSLYFEMAPQGEWARLAKKSTDDGSPSVRIEIDDQAGAINIETSGQDVNVKSGGGNLTLDSEGGQVQVMEGGTPQPVAVQNHTHPYSWDGDGGSGDTGTPNESGTNTEVE